MKEKLIESITSKHTDEDKQKLKEIAKSLDLSLSEYVRDIAKKSIEQYEISDQFQTVTGYFSRDTKDTKEKLFSFFGIEIYVRKKAQQLRPVELFKTNPLGNE